jgi:hypothetical protein
MFAKLPRKRLLPIGAPVVAAPIARLTLVIPPQLTAVDAMMRFIIAARALFLIGVHASRETYVGVARLLHKINWCNFTLIF